MTALHAGLLHAICSDPADDVPRLVFADYLDEHGQPEYASFIRVQLELAERFTWEYRCRLRQPAECGECGWCKRNTVLRERESELLASNGYQFACPDISPESWEGSLPRFTWSRGFVSSVILDTSSWLAHGPALVRSQPITGVRLSDREPMFHSEGSFLWCNRPNRWGDYQDLRSGFDVPPEIVAHMTFDKVGFSRHPSDTAALLTLSDACVAWARDKAGLPATKGG